MLRQLVIQDVVLIDRLAIEFEQGLGVLTGETGAGKSILLDALGLALGNRADVSLVRSGQAAASVSAEIELPGGHAALGVLAEQGIVFGIARPRGLFWLMLERAGVAEKIGKQNLFHTVHAGAESFRRNGNVDASQGH